VLLEALGNPERHFSHIHVGGTNGKGSVATMVYSALRRAGCNAALYTSPHLVDLRERMIVNDSPIPRDAFREWTELLQHQIDACDASFFEATTAIAFADFAARGADIAVIEVGLGGRLDATNVVTPLVSAVVSLSLEHTDYLGTSLEEIAGEKAGIAKPGTPFVVGEPDRRLAQLLEDRAVELGATVHAMPEARLYDGSMTMFGVHQRRNAAVAETILRLLPEAVRPDAPEIREGIGSAFVPGRFDRRGRWLLDVAHNPAGIAALLTQIRESNLARPIHALVSMVDDKDWKTILPMLRTEVDLICLTVAPSMPGDRCPDLQRMVDGTGIDFHTEPDFDVALAHVQQGAGTVLVTGSFFTVGDAMARLPGFPPLG
jgi:dihydrofolate synthase/folylpolyglutamate synthase